MDGPGERRQDLRRRRSPLLRYSNEVASLCTTGELMAISRPSSCQFATRAPRIARRGRHREADTEATGELVTRAHFDTAPAQETSRPGGYSPVAAEKLPADHRSR